MNETYVIGLISSFSVGIPFLVGAFRLKKISFDMKLLVALFAFTFLVEGYSVWQFLRHTNGQWIHHLYSPVEYSFFMTVFSFWQKNERIKRAIRWSIPIFIAICMISLSFQDTHYLNGYTESLACLLYVPVSGYTLLKLMENGQGIPFRDGRYWISSGLFFYSSGGLAYFTFDSLMSANLSFNLWVFHSFLNVSANIFYAMGFVWQQRT